MAAGLLSTLAGSTGAGASVAGSFLKYGKSDSRIHASERV